jgi:hypothetical protein
MATIVAMRARAGRRQRPSIDEREVRSLGEFVDAVTPDVDPRRRSAARERARSNATSCARMRAMAVARAIRRYYD